MMVYIEMCDLKALINSPTKRKGTRKLNSSLHETYMEINNLKNFMVLLMVIIIKAVSSSISPSNAWSSP